ncbi:MAG TPA: hypothetical protein VGR89_01230 [Puia sp.]|nr:hypothetical protein [Puia sp.]
MSQAKVTISQELLSKLQQLQQMGGNDPIMRDVATSMLAEVHDRIHESGLNSSGAPIGTYSPGYMKVRTGNFGNAQRFSRGKHKGDVRTAGVFTKGTHKGEPRPNYNRTSDTKVVASLTRQMENDFKVVATGRGYGLGYSNDENFNKSQYVEATYEEKIFDLTEEEREKSIAMAGQLIIKFLNQ